MADASEEDDMGGAGGGAVALICIDSRRGKRSAETSGYAEFIGEARCACWLGLRGTTADFGLSSSESSRSRLFELEAGLAAGTSRLPAIVRSLSRSLAQPMGIYIQHDIREK